MSSRIFKYTTVMLAAVVALFVVWHIPLLWTSPAEETPYQKYIVLPDQWDSKTWEGGVTETRYDASYDRCRMEIDKQEKNRTMIFMSLVCDTESYGIADASRSGEKHSFVTEPFDFGFIQEGLDSCSVGIEHLDGVEHLYGAYQNVNIDISCRINSPE